jgi:hypothetical protein
MIFQHTWRAVIEQDKWQTRRLVKPHESALWETINAIEYPAGETPIPAKFPDEYKVGYYNYDEHPTRTRWVYEVGKTYAVQPGRAMPAIWWRKVFGKLEYAHECYELEDPDAPLNIALSDYEILDGDPKELTRYGYQQARIQITNIRREDVRNISDADVKAEFFEDCFAFWETWCGMHDHAVQFVSLGAGWLVGLRSEWKQGMCWGEGEWAFKGLMTRPSKRYDAWILEFKLAC